ncbi:hypothetical protein BGX20_002011, partial [Mortierella sp. AD010]
MQLRHITRPRATATEDDHGVDPNYFITIRETDLSEQLSFPQSQDDLDTHSSHSLSTFEDDDFCRIDSIGPVSSTPFTRLAQGSVQVSAYGVAHTAVEDDSTDLRRSLLVMDSSAISKDYNNNPPALAAVLQNNEDR